jgi:hypothetical protein
MKDLIKIAREAALEEIRKYDSPNPVHFDIANRVGQKIAGNMHVDANIVLLGTTLMDFKIGQALSEDRLKEHIFMSKEAVETLLMSHDCPEASLKKILDCIGGHHKTAAWTCSEAEICANADCYRFLTPRGIISFLQQIGKREMNLDDSLAYALSKVEEKWQILSLPQCRQELESNYLLLKKLLSSG